MSIQKVIQSTVCFAASGFGTCVAGLFSVLQFTLTVILNEVSALLAILAVGLYSWDLENSSSSSAYGYSSALTPKHRREADPLMFFKDLDVVKIFVIQMVYSVVVIWQVSTQTLFSEFTH